MKNTNINFSSILAQKGINVYKLRSIKKSSILIFLLVCVFITAVALISNKASNSSKLSTSNKVSQIDKLTNKLITDAYQKDLVTYKDAVTNKITANAKKIIDFKNDKEYIKVDKENSFKNKLLELEYMNRDLGKKIENYKVSGEYEWELFKIEFTNDLDELGRKINGIVGDKKQ